MADVFGLAKSVIAVIQIADRVVGLCKFYIEATSDTPSDLRAIFIEISTLKTIFENLEFLRASDNTSSLMLKQLSGQNGPIEGCRKSVTELERLFPSDSVQTLGQEASRSKRRKVKIAFTTLAWPLKAEKARLLLQQIVQYKTSINFALTTELIHDIKDIKGKNTEIHNILTDSQRQELYRWLEHTDPSPLHNRALQQYEAETGSWILRSPKWTNWLDAQDRCLWIHGIPGAGKTILASFLIEQIKKRCDQLPNGKCIYSYYYCYFGHGQDEATPFLRRIVCQLCRQIDVIPVEVQRLHKSGGVPGLGELLTAVKAILESCDVAFVVIDAMDESSPRIDLLKVIRDLATDSRFSKVQILATSREYVDIERTMEDISSSVPMSNPLVEEDIRVHVRSKLHLNDKFRRWPEDLLSDVEEAVATGAKGMFRWAVCQLDVLQRLKCERHIVRNALATLPKTLDETYERVFLCIPREEWPFVHHALQWIHYHNELYHGEGIPCSTLLNAIQRSIDPLDERYDDQFYDVDRLRELCGCLIHVTAEDPSHTGTLKTVVGISFAHYTVREYLDSARILTGPTASFAISTRAIKQQFTEIALREAKNFQLPDEWTSDTFLLHESKVHDRLYGDLALYCLASALVSITIWQEEICQLNRLFDLVKEFLDPTKPHFDDLCTATNIISIFTLLFLDAEWYDEFQFCNISWQPAPNKADDVILLNLFLMSGFSVSSLAKKFLEEGDVKNLVSSRLTFTKSVWNVLSEGDAEVYSFNGSIIEVMAQCAFRNPGNFKLLLNNSTGLYDPSDILVSFIGSHGDCFPSYGLLEHILQAGADPNVKGYRVTPLQMATVSWDYIGVRMLLEAGADPNCIGDKDGVQWEAKALLGRFNFLHGLTPLYIHRNLGCILKDRRQDARASEARGIASLLLQYGARAYREQ